VVSKQVVRVVDSNRRSVSDHYGLAVTLEAATTELKDHFTCANYTAIASQPPDSLNATYGAA
jgi:hypothetical protein